MPSIASLRLLIVAALFAVSLAACCSTPSRDALPEPPSASAVPIDTDAGHIILPVTIAGEGPLWAMLDTGNPDTTIFKSLADRLALDTQPYGELQGLGEGSLPVERAEGVTVAIGERGGAASFVEPTVTVLPDEAAFPPIDGKQIDVFLGATFIERFALTIDGGAGLMTLRDAEAYQPPADARILPLRLEAGFPYVLGAVTPDAGPAADEPIRGAFLIDLGAAYGVQIDHDAAPAAGLLDPELPGRETVGVVAGIDGQPLELASLPARRIVMGGVTLDEPRFVVLPVQGGGPPIENLVGTIGAAAFQNQTITLDYQGRRLVIH